MKNYVLISSLLLILTLFFISATIENFRSVPPTGFILVDTNYYLSKKATPEGAWEDYQWYLALKKMPLNGTYPDTTILYNGNVYYKNRKYDFSPLVGVSYSQFLDFCKWRSDLFNKIKSLPPTSCNRKYWVKLQSIDPKNEYQIEFFIPAYKDVKDVKFLDCKYRTMFSDTIVGEPNPAFNNDSVYTFYTAARYVKR